MVKSMEKVRKFGLMIVDMKVPFRMDLEMDKGLWFGPMRRCTRGAGNGT